MKVMHEKQLDGVSGPMEESGAHTVGAPNVAGNSSQRQKVTGISVR